MAQVTSPIILDSTGQQIHSDLQQIKTVLTTPSAAEDITFDNTGTGMQADDVQDAITELKSNLTVKLETDDLLIANISITTNTAQPLWSGLYNGSYDYTNIYNQYGDPISLYVLWSQGNRPCLCHAHPTEHKITYETNYNGNGGIVRAVWLKKSYTPTTLP